MRYDFGHFRENPDKIIVDGQEIKITSYEGASGHSQTNHNWFGAIDTVDTTFWLGSVWSWWLEGAGDVTWQVTFDKPLPLFAIESNISYTQDEFRYVIQYFDGSVWHDLYQFPGNNTGNHKYSGYVPSPLLISDITSDMYLYIQGLKITTKMIRGFETSHLPLSIYDLVLHFRDSDEPNNYTEGVYLEDELEPRVRGYVNTEGVYLEDELEPRVRGYVNTEGIYLKEDLESNGILKKLDTFENFNGLYLDDNIEPNGILKQFDDFKVFNGLYLKDDIESGGILKQFDDFKVFNGLYLKDDIESGGILKQFDDFKVFNGLYLDDDLNIEHIFKINGYAFIM